MSSAARTEIERLEAARARAIVATDIAALDAMTDNDYLHIDGDGQQRDKTGFLGVVGATTGRFTHYEVTDTVILISADLAAVHGRFDNEHRATDGSVRIKAGRHVRLYRLGPDGWRNTLHQATLVPTEELAPASVGASRATTSN